MSGYAATGWSWPGALLGLVFALGVALVVVGLPRNRRPGLTERLGPYLRDSAPPSRLLARQATAGGPFARALAPLVRDLGARVDRVLGGSASVRSRLMRAGRPGDVEAFRAEQILWGAVGAVLGIVVGMLAVLTRGSSPPAVVLAVVAASASGILLRDQWLTRQARRRETRMLAEFPTVAELLALAVGAGEGATGALDRVCRLSHGELSAELAQCLADARAGANLPTALQGLADRTGLLSLSRFVDGMVVAVQLSLIHI